MITRTLANVCWIKRILTSTDLCSHNDYTANLITTSTKQYNYV